MQVAQEQSGQTDEFQYEYAKPFVYVGVEVILLRAANNDGNYEAFRQYEPGFGPGSVNLTTE